MSNIRMEESWKTALHQEFDQSYFKNLADFVRAEYQFKKVFPPPSQVFRAFDLCPFDAVRVVIIGQDPYHGEGQANGLSFAVKEGMRLPPSLQNIFKEIEQDLRIKPYQNGDLSRWAKQGVLMLNAVLTVLAHAPASHQGKGWEQFTDAVIKQLNDKREHIVYMLWGKYAQEKGAVIDRTRNLVLESAHPSPYSATRFFGNHHFSQCNTYLALQGETPIDWQ